MAPKRKRAGNQDLSITCFLVTVSLCHPGNPSSLVYLKKLMQNPCFEALAAWCQADARCGRLKLKDLLVQPLQRLTRCVYPTPRHPCFWALPGAKRARSVSSVVHTLVSFRVCQLAQTNRSRSQLTALALFGVVVAGTPS